MNAPTAPDHRSRPLLGPSGFEVTCDQCFELLDRYVDLELDGVDADARLPGLRAHLAGCPACRRTTRACGRSSVAAGADS